MTDEERGMKSFNRNRLMKLRNWDQWDSAFDSQLEGHADAATLGEPVLRSSLGGDESNLLRIQWSNIVKDGGRRKARMCIDGSKRSAPWLRELASTYASCIETPCMRLFFALAALECMTVTIADSTNAYQQSPGPSVPCFLRIDDAYASCI